MFTIHPTHSTIDDDDSLDENYLFQSSPHHHGLLDLPLTAEHTDAHFDLREPASLPLSGFDHLDYEQYNESHPPDAHFADAIGASGLDGSQTSMKGDVDPPAAASKDDLPDGDGEGSAHSNSWRPHVSQNGDATASTTNTPPSIQAKPPSSKLMRKKSESLRTLVAGSSQSDSSLMNGSARHASTTSSGRDSQGPNGVKTPDTPISMDLPVNGYAQRGGPLHFNKKNLPDPKPKSSIPSNISPREFGAQCVLAAYASRLDPFALSKLEYELLKDHISRPEVTAYINIRNAILRLWMRAPLVHVTREEALGCAKDARYFPMAEVAYSWLVRNGYINFGCLELPSTAGPIRRVKAKARKQRTIVVIGAGVSGLGCARQLEGLSLQLGHLFTEDGEKPPKVVVLEGRNRIGGRVYSHPLKDQKNTLPADLRATVEMGAQIITGFEHGNPLNILVRGQLGLHYHRLRDNTILYDHDGQVVDRDRDALVESLYNDILERASIYRNKPPTTNTVKGDEDKIWYSKDPDMEGDKMISALDESEDVVTVAKSGRGKTSGKERLAGRAYQLSSGQNASKSAAQAAKAMGWELKGWITEDDTLQLDPIAQTQKYPTLGETMDEGIRQYQNMVGLSPQDLRLLNWHHANLEYANAVSVNQLSLGGWDQDIGNEFEGFHSVVKGGYIQVPRGLWRCPTTLDVRFGHVVKKIHYHTTDDSLPATVECNNGEIFEADAVVLTAPLGVLKEGTISFEPKLPEWKTGAIERLGFGLLNKVILVFDTPFWEENRDMFGLLNEAAVSNSLNQKDYAAGRGRAYLFWNCIKMSGRPVLSALMAGNAAHEVETTDDASLVQQVMDRLKKMFSPRTVPEPSETIVTRWKRDPFAKGSYSYVGPTSIPGDYDAMAKRHGQLFFAGEATCGTHPATVHGAYLSGLRAASDVTDLLLGPMQLPTPLVQRQAQPARVSSVSSSVAGSKRTLEEAGIDEETLSLKQREEDYEAAIIGAILASIGERPVKPGKQGVNPFLLYTKDYWFKCKEECDKARKASSGNPEAKASREEIRSTVGKWWRTASEETKQPYLEAGQRAQEETARNVADFKEKVAVWDREAARIRQEYMEAHPKPSGFKGLTAIESGGGRSGMRRVDSM